MCVILPELFSFLLSQVLKCSAHQRKEFWICAAFMKGYLERESPIRCEIYFLMNPIYINVGSLKDNYCAAERTAASINGMSLIVLVV